MLESKTIVFSLLLGMCCALPTFAQDSEVFGGLSANADYVKNRGVIVTSDQTVSPFFSHGSGPAGFELAFKRYLHKGLGMKFDLSGYSDVFPPGPAIYCQPSGCSTGLTFQATGRSVYLTAGPDWKIWRDKRFAPFAQTLGGIVYNRAKIKVTGSNTGEPFKGGLILYSGAGFPNGNINYSDSNADAGLTLSIGGGFDIRLSKKFSLRTAMDYAPTFLVRPVVHDPVVNAQGLLFLPQQTPSERRLQGHTRLTMGVVWRIR